MKPIIQNIISTVNLGCILDLKKISQIGYNVEYKPERFNALIMRIKSPKTTTLVFSSGKIVCTGAKTEKESYRASTRFARIIQKFGFAVKFLNFKIQNFVASVNLNFKINITLLSQFHFDFCNFEPELFPGLIYRMKNPSVLFAIFNSGKINITGANKHSEIFEGFEKLFSSLKNFKFDI